MAACCPRWARRCRARYGYLLAFHILLLCAAGRNPTEIAAFLFCSRSSVYRIVRAYRTGSLGIRVDQDGQLSIAMRMTVLKQLLESVRRKSVLPRLSNDGGSRLLGRLFRLEFLGFCFNTLGCALVRGSTREIRGRDRKST